MIDLLIRNVSVQGEQARLDFAVDHGVLVERGIGLNYTALNEINMDGQLLIPGFVEGHIHLDIALMNDWEKPGRPKPFRSPVELNLAMEQGRKTFIREHIEQRAGQALELASRHGVTAMRAQCQVDPEVGLRHLEALLSVRERYGQQVTLQIVAFPQQGFFGMAGGLDLFREAFRLGADVMGCASNLERGNVAGFRQHIDAALNLAMELDVDLDMHADLGIPPTAGLDDLEVVYAARQITKLGYQGRATAGHLCALDSLMPDVAEQAIEMIHAAQMNAISQPDMYRLGREDSHHVRRGLTRVKQLLAAGVNVAYASNNVRDAFRPLGNFDLLEEGLVLAYGAHMDSVDELETLLKMSTYNPARMLKLENYGLQPGCQADFVILDASSPSAAIVGQAEKLYVFKAGRLVAKNQRSSVLIDHDNPSGWEQPQEKI
ncbi:MAG TPA: amidohydrolase family protein [Anaerolineales bacterium]|jgi:cytosine deaminase